MFTPLHLCFWSDSTCRNHSFFKQKKESQYQHLNKELLIQVKGTCNYKILLEYKTHKPFTDIKEHLFFKEWRDGVQDGGEQGGAVLALLGHGARLHVVLSQPAGVRLHRRQRLRVPGNDERINTAWKKKLRPIRYIRPNIYIYIYIHMIELSIFSRTVYLFISL